MPVTINASTSSGLVQSADNSGQIELQSNGTTKATVSSSGLAIGQYNPSTSLITSGTAVASTSGTSIDFTGIPSWVKRITVMFNAVSTNGTSGLLVQLGTSSGITSSGYNASSINANMSSGTSGLSSTAGFVISSAVAADASSGILTITNVNSNNWVSSHSLKRATTVCIFGGGDSSLAATLDRVRITTVNGTDTFDAGTINILYE